MNNNNLWLLIVIAISLIYLLPLLGIWAVNTLFGLSIQGTFINWFAALVLIGLAKST